MRRYGCAGCGRGWRRRARWRCCCRRPSGSTARRPGRSSPRSGPASPSGAPPWLWRPGHPGPRRAPALGVTTVAAAALGLSAWRHRRRPGARGGRERSRSRSSAANVWLGRADPAALAAMITAERPDVVVLPEAGRPVPQAPPRRSRRLPRVVRRAGPGVGGGGGCRGRAVPDGAHGGPAGRGGRGGGLVGDPLGWVVVSGGGLGAVRVLGVHPAVLLPATTDDWARELALLRPWLSDPARPTVVVGDLNATLEHGPLQAALGVGRPVTRRVAATWPSALAARARGDHRPRARRGPGRCALGRGARRARKRPPWGARPLRGVRCRRPPGRRSGETRWA